MGYLELIHRMKLRAPCGSYTGCDADDGSWTAEQLMVFDRLCRVFDEPAKLVHGRRDNVPALSPPGVLLKNCLL